MTCIICHGEDIPVTNVREALPLGPDVVYVPIQIPVCRTCGERYYDRRTMRFLEEVTQKLQAGQARLQEVGKILLYSAEPMPVGA
jgi:YgiT-type zinc finger domain-containing protein